MIGCAATPLAAKFARTKVRKLGRSSRAGRNVRNVGQLAWLTTLKSRSWRGNGRNSVEFGSAVRCWNQPAVYRQTEYTVSASSQ